MFDVSCFKIRVYGVLNLESKQKRREKKLLKRKFGLMKNDLRKKVARVSRLVCGEQFFHGPGDPCYIKKVNQ